MSELLPYDLKSPVLRTPEEEWRPHAWNSDESTEWWYITSCFYDTSGTPYMLVWCLFNFTGKDAMMGAVAPPEHRLGNVLGGLTDYGSQHHLQATPSAMVLGRDMWDEERSEITFLTPDSETRWRYQGDEVELTFTNPKFNGSFKMTGAEQVMFAKDHLGIEGFIQEGGPDDRSFYYSLPRLALRGQLEFEQADGTRKSVDVQGPAWIDRQWGDFLTKAWEWTSFRFDSGGRLNLYNFATGHQTASYQDADGETSWFDSFIVEQDGYLKADNGIWMSWGWTYEFDHEIEGCRRLRVVPKSRLDVYSSEFQTMFEGASDIYDDSTGKLLGVAVTESMDVRQMENYPNGPHQR